MLTNSLFKFLRDDRGAVAAMTATLLPVLVGGMALGAEAGYWHMSQRKLQHAADVAAYAAAVQLRSGRSEAAISAAATAVADDIEMRFGEDALTVNWPPATGALAGDGMAVEVTIRREQRRFFTLIYDDEDVPISARAVAVVTGGGDACVLALDPNASGAISVGGSTTATFENCDVAANSVSEQAFDMVGGAASFTSGCLRTVGGVDENGGLNLTECATPHVQSPPVQDPYADVAEPDFGCGCSNSSVGKKRGSHTEKATYYHPLGMKYRRYCGGLKVKGNTTFAPGLYIVDGGEFRINSNANVSGTGVTFFLTNGARLRFNGNATVQFSAPETGHFAGMLIFSDRDDVGVEHRVNGSAASQMSGAIYTPTSDIRYSGNFSGPNGCTQMVSRRITFTGNSSITVDCSAAGARRIPTGETIALVE